MKPLSLSFPRSGWQHAQIARNELLALYVRSKTGLPDHFELVRIKPVEETVLFGKTVEAHEAYPSSEEWGSKGWTFNDLATAKQRLSELTDSLRQAKPASAAQSGAAQPH